MTRAASNRITVSNLHRYLRFSRRQTLRLVRSVLRGEGDSGWTIGVVFVSDDRMKRLNAHYLGQKSTTDVLSFTYEAQSQREGDVVVCLDQARRQAPLYGATYTMEVARLIIHGVLHLLGFDDAGPRLRARMKKKEDGYLGKTYARTRH